MPPHDPSNRRLCNAVQLSSMNAEMSGDRRMKLEIFLMIMLGTLPLNSAEYSLKDLVYAHYRCNIEIEHKRLSISEIQICSDLYTRLKLKFVPNVDLKSFELLDVKKKTSINSAGYLAFKDWEKSNPDIVQQLEEKAKEIAKSF